MPQLADLIRKKYPNTYDDMSDDELEKAVIEKHPQYSDLTTPKSDIVKLDTAKPDITKPDQQQFVGPIEPHVSPETEVERWARQPWYKKAWDIASEPATKAPSRWAKSIADYIDKPSLDLSNHPEYAALRGFGAGAVQGIGDLASSFTSPIAAGLSLIGLGEGGAVKAGLPELNNILEYGTKALSVPVTAHGAYKALAPNSSLSDRFQGVTEAAGGLLGLKNNLSNIAEESLGKKSGEPIIEQPNEPIITQPQLQDESGRSLGPNVSVASDRPSGPWDNNITPDTIRPQGLTDQGLYDIARDKFNMGRDLPLNRDLPLKNIGDNIVNKNIPNEDIEPSFARTESGGSKVDIGDTKDMIKIFRNTYSGSVPHVAAKELIQNAIDAVAEVPNGKVDINVNPKTHTITVSDNGPGLTRDMIDTVYTNLSASGKRGGPTKTIGELGVGKTTYMIAGEHVAVNTVSREADGKLYKYTFEGTPEQLMEEFHPVKTLVPEGTPTGTTIKMTASSNSKYDDLANYVSNFDKYSSNPVPINIIRGPIHSWESVQKYNIQPRSNIGGRLIGEHELPETKFKATIPNDASWEETDGIHLIINNRGMFQGVDNFYVGSGKIELPDRLVIDLDPKVPGNDPMYPLTAPTRERLKFETKRMVEKYIKENFIDVIRDKRKNEVTNIYNNLVQSPTKHLIYDGGNRYTPEEYQNINNSKIMNQIGNVIKSVTDELHNTIPSPRRTVRTGLILDNVRGVNLKNPAKDNETVLLVNPFAEIEDNNPKTAAQGIVHIIMHEYNHNIVREEGKDYTAHLATLYEKFDLERQLDARNQIVQQLTAGGQNYHPEVTKLLQEYKDSRGRPATTNDLLIREAGSGYLGSKEQGSISEHNKPAREGTLVSPIQFNPPGKKGMTGGNGDILPPKEGINQSPSSNGPYEPSGGEIYPWPKWPNMKGQRSYEPIGPQIGSKIKAGSEKPSRNYFNPPTYNRGPNELDPTKPKWPEMEGQKSYSPNNKPPSSNIKPGAEPVKQSENSMLQNVYDLPRGTMSADPPFITSAAFRQGASLAGTKQWFKGWVDAAKAFGSEDTYKKVMDQINADPIFQEKKNTAGQIQPSYADQVGLRRTSLSSYSSREEPLRSELAEKIPLYGRYIRASNRAFTAFTNSVGNSTFRNLIYDASKLSKEGKSGGITGNLLTKQGTPDPFVDLTAGRAIADYVNTALRRGKIGAEIGPWEANLEKNGKLLSNLFFSPRSIASQARMLNPSTYIMANPFVRRQYLASMVRQVGMWWTVAELAHLAGAQVSHDPNSADFGKIKIGNTRIDVPGGLQQYLVLGNRMLPQSLGGGGVTSTTSNRFTPFGKGYKPETRTGQIAQFFVNRLHPTLKYGFDAGANTEKTPFHVMDRTAQLALPMFTDDLYQVAKDNPELVPLIYGTSGAGIGTQTYERGSYGKPVFIPEKYDWNIGAKKY